MHIPRPAGPHSTLSRACGAVIVAALLTVSTAQACGIDGVPSALIAHHRVLLNQTVPTPQTWRTWTQFLTAAPLHVGQVATFAEDLSLLRRTIPARFLSQPWLWVFGDGTQARGWNVSHRYTRPGRYIIFVNTFESSERSWFRLDTVGARVIQ